MQSEDKTSKKKDQQLCLIIFCFAASLQYNVKFHGRSSLSYIFFNSGSFSIPESKNATMFRVLEFLKSSIFFENYNYNYN